MDICNISEYFKLNNKFSIAAYCHTDVPLHRHNFFELAYVTDGKACSVQLGGLVRVPYSGETAPAVGWNLLAADGNGGVSVVTSGGHSYLAVEVDTTGKTMTIML